jgi:hypothetical protein
MKTSYLLMARFESPTVALKEISEEFFGITAKTAQQLAKAGNFPVSTFQLRDSEKSPVLIHIDELAEYIDQQRNQAKEVWQSVNP